MATDSYLVIGNRPWNRRIFEETLCILPGNWSFLSEKHELTRELIEELEPRYLFFLHWSYIVPKNIVRDYECVCFHMTDVPYGRGGSPLQNLIVRGHHETKLSALRMIDELDAGPVYMKVQLSLQGSAEEIYIRSNELAVEIIKEMIRSKPEPIPQQGEVTTFKRRTPEESVITNMGDLVKLYDFIRMLDAEGYPQAFINHKGFRFEFSSVRLGQDQLEARVSVTLNDSTEEKK